MTTEFPRWVKSSYSNNGGDCIEVATDLVDSRGVVPVRDSKDPSGPVLMLLPTTFTGLVEFARQAAI
ncbi:DUF397 domain-containing protein [Streptomyces sp. NRRL F-5755]|uniref:DUF397 domain-containing protein n=1 Tax=Streptomyces sp. NRRL F-5755 TaxID=1519475 RepID=UPI0006AE19A1|nr:DUF397 domain-containing protein [Streptomyces sp. NRRL F-5755]